MHIAKSYALRMRAGRPGGGKGPLMQDNVSGAITTVNDQTVFNEQDDFDPRRLTPIEYERLQGFSDNYTQIPYNGKPESECPDSPRYKALGNSMAVPVMRWLGERIQMVEEILNETND